MANILTIALAATLVRSLDTGLFNIADKPLLPAANNGDRIVLFTVPNNMRITLAHLRQTAAMGASATMKLQRNRGGAYVDLTAATTAATAGVVSSAGILPLDLIAGDTVEVLVGGGNLTAGVIEYDIAAQRA